MILALYLAVILILALLLGATWVAALWGASFAALTPLYVIGILVAVCLVLGARYAKNRLTRP